MYRVRKLMEQGEQENEADCLKFCMKLNRIRKESETFVSKDTMARVKKLEMEIPVMGPPAIFVRLKVNHPRIKKIIGEMLCRYLTCIILDKQDAVKDFVKMLVLRSMYGQDGAQNWVYVDNLRPKTKDEEERVNELEGVVLDGPDKLEEALKLSLQSSRGEKRKNQDEEETGPSKKVKLDEAKCEDNDEVEDAEVGDKESNNEDDTTNDNMNDTTIDQSIYAVEEKKLLKFPTILDLLSIDNDVVKNLLIEKCNIDKMLVVPQFERFLEYLPDLSKANKTIVGCDGDGKVLSIDPSSFHDISCDMVMGYIDPSPIAFNNPEKMLLEWGGKDLRSRWPEFAKHLEGEPKTDEVKASTSRGFNPMVAEEGKASTSTVTGSVTDIMASLAARGISIQKK